MSDDPSAANRATRVRMLDVAARAGVSPATASRSLRGKSKVAAETRQRVLDAARELSYDATAGARDGSGPRRCVAVIVPFITRWYFSTVTAEAVDLLREQGYDVLLYHLGSAEVRDSFFERLPLGGRVDGILTLSMPLTEDHTLALRALGIPLVSIGSTVPGAPSVGTDELAAARMAVTHLVNLRHVRIGLIAGEPDDPRFNFIAAAARRRGYAQALAAAGITVDEGLVATGRYGPQGGAAAMAELLARPVMPTAVFAEYDELALGALCALRRTGLRVPEDISVIGIDDHEMAALQELTTVSQSVPEQGRVAAELLVRVLRDGPASVANEPVILPTRLVLRGTTASLAGKADARSPETGWTGQLM